MKISSVLFLFSQKQVLYFNKSSSYIIGPINVPIECTSKKAIVTVEEPIIDFKKVYQSLKSLLLIKIGYLWWIFKETY